MLIGKDIDILSDHKNWDSSKI